MTSGAMARDGRSASTHWKEVSGRSHRSSSQGKPSRAKLGMSQGEAAPVAWLTAAQRDAWVEDTKQTPFAVSGAIFSFYLVHVLSLRILTLRPRRLDVAQQWRLQHA